MFCETEAGEIVVVPGCMASTLQLPAFSKFKVLPLTVQIDSSSDLKETKRPAEEFAESERFLLAKSIELGSSN